MSEYFFYKLLSTSRHSACLHGWYGDFTFTFVTRVFCYIDIVKVFFSRNLSVHYEVQKESHIKPVRSCVRR